MSHDETQITLDMSRLVRESNRYTQVRPDSVAVYNACSATEARSFTWMTAMKISCVHTTNDVCINRHHVIRACLIGRVRLLARPLSLEQIRQVIKQRPYDSRDELIERLVPDGPRFRYKEREKKRHVSCTSVARRKVVDTRRTRSRFEFEKKTRRENSVHRR